ncbi:MULTISPECIES: hypothetical protein [Clostridium]|uniref:hypothetical protein n=1 Tax=Clostridium TaxID=1485 RepID=UPI0005C1D8B7|nr:MULTISPECIES: hypothetical protein [Clostridium]AXB86875.1 hypothetical protein DRB99_18345 [Clostridium butyricum]KIU04744.1 hypothetical protein SC08_Contig95orf00177 [Clostridium butyricum]MBA8968742.1 large-conductance mechanosensitive channel [Clostridium butyricum]MBA8973403.1 large-conductance mechanosensitive channel [Clostridium butyricum]MBC2426176.1 hypothetical protein [Clostridium butyricum]
MGIEFFIIALILFIVFNVVYYIPNKLKEQQEKQALYFKELYIRLNRLEKKIDEISSYDEK